MASDQSWRWKGFSYLRFAFSINEGYFPNIHMRYRMDQPPYQKFFWYIALSPRWKWNNGRRAA